MAQSDKQVRKETGQDAEDAETASKDDTRTIAVADSPADEVGVRLVTKRLLYDGHDLTESRRVSCLLKGTKQIGPVLLRQIELARTLIGDVDGDDADNLLAEGLCSDWNIGQSFLKIATCELTAGAIQAGQSNGPLFIP